MPKNVLLLDADQFAYRCAFACERAVDFGNNTIAKWADKKEIACALEDMIEQARMDTSLSDVYFGHSSDTNFRKDLWPSYKANRDPKAKPVGLKHALQYLRDKYPVLEHPRLEADDILGVYGHKWKSSVIWANDKDFLTVPCNLFRKGDMHWISEEQADKNLMIQTITGDSTDNFKGCEGIGPVKAMRYLEEFGYSWANVLTFFQKCGYDIVYACTMAKLARICRKVSDATRWYPMRYTRKELAQHAQQIQSEDF